MNDRMESFRDIFRGFTIGIIGSSPRIEAIKPDFLRGRISIALNESFLVLPDSPTFVHASERKVFEFVKDKHPRVIGTSPLYDGAALPKGSLFVRARLGSSNNQQDFDEAAEKAVDGAFCKFPALGTCFHTAVFAAVFMGARNIISIGVDDANGYAKGIQALKESGKRLNFRPLDREKWLEQRKKQRRGHGMLLNALRKVGVTWTKIRV